MNTANSTNAINPPNSGQYMPVNIYEPATGGRQSAVTGSRAWRNLLAGDLYARRLVREAVRAGPLFDPAPYTSEIELASLAAHVARLLGRRSRR